MLGRPRVAGLSTVPVQDPIQVTFLRHGQSTWNKQNIFIGMTDTPLTEDGIREAKCAGTMLAEAGAQFDAVHTSLLQRSTDTVYYALKELEAHWLNVNKDWRLNERSYGALVGTNKKQCVEEFGKDQVKRWRRSWDEPPPPMSRESPYWPYKDPRYKQLGIKEEDIPLSESLKCVTKRSSVFWDEVVVPQLKAGQRVLIVGHENNLRSLIKRLDNISDSDIINIELPRAIPLVYHLDRNNLKPMEVEGAAPGLSGRYLCSPEELAAIAERDFKQVYDVTPAPATALEDLKVSPTTTTAASAGSGSGSGSGGGAPISIYSHAPLSSPNPPQEQPQGHLQQLKAHYSTATSDS
eukprot:CAMPEP_0175021730 /NCGR_PEP_ID=MMETSP0005-20121125/14871_1 /TAXON_ID=420556 /ORGANISM="Ochromonas sp., Strain CCMP1393" /LENGTH=350 /DNA_ID=CAMNT_0016279799 /DNA_START=62 /DNA_END=1114 /DNA_ORIENTATION=-